MTAEVIQVSREDFAKGNRRRGVWYVDEPAHIIILPVVRIERPAETPDDWPIGRGRGRRRNQR